MSSTVTPKAHQARVRRLARKHGLDISMTGSRKPEYWDFGFCYLVDPWTTGIVAGPMSLQHAAEEVLERAATTE